MRAATPLCAAKGDQLEPSSGPRHGDTRVLITGGNLTGGSDYRCAFGDNTLPVYAEHMNLTTSTIYCVAPAHIYSPTWSLSSYHSTASSIRETMSSSACTLPSRLMCSHQQQDRQMARLSSSSREAHSRMARITDAASPLAALQLKACRLVLLCRLLALDS